MVRVKKVVVDLDNPVWFTPAGHGLTLDFDGHFCSLGKLGECIESNHRRGYELYRKLAKKKTERIYGINDTYANGAWDERGHWEAIAQMLKDLKAAGKVRFIGNKLLKKLKQELAGNVNV